MVTNNDYEMLCKQVGEVAPEAEKYLREEAYLIANFYPSKSLGEVFLWRLTPQGYMYWYNIAYLLRVYEQARKLTTQIT